MKFSLRTTSLILCIVMIATLFTSVYAFADGAGKPGPDDIVGASKYLVAPKDDSWLDEYKEGYVYGPSYGRAAYRFMASGAPTHLKSVAQGTAITLLALERGRYLVKTDAGDIFWLSQDCYSDHYVAPGRLMSGNADVDANGPCLKDIEGFNPEMDIPGPRDWLDERVECYVYAPKHHRGAEMFYYNHEPTSAKAKEMGWDVYRRMGTVKQGTAITLLAHVGNRYLVKTDAGQLFWMYDWCTSDTYVAYGEAK